jgi:hypothetical protein
MLEKVLWHFVARSDDSGGFLWVFALLYEHSYMPFHTNRWLVFVFVFLRSVHRLIVTTNVPSSRILVALMMEAVRSSETSVLTSATGITSQKTPFFIL